MKYQQIENDLTEICSQEEIAEFEAMVKAVNNDPMRTLKGLNAKEYVDFYVLACLTSYRYNKDCALFKINNIDGKEKVEKNIKSEYDELYKKNREYLNAKNLIERYSLLLDVPKFTLGGKSVIQVAKLIVEQSKSNDAKNKNKEKIEFYLNYIKDTDKALGLNREDQPGEE